MFPNVFLCAFFLVSLVSFSVNLQPLTIICGKGRSCLTCCSNKLEHTPSSIQVVGLLDLQPLSIINHHYPLSSMNRHHYLSSIINFIRHQQCHLETPQNHVLETVIVFWGQHHNRKSWRVRFIWQRFPWVFRGSPCRWWCGDVVGRTSGGWWYSMGVHLSHEKNPPTFHYTGWLIGILLMVYYNPYIIG